ncbi:MAG: GerMN domain-containing protein [Lachnospiraceae bacterium]|nr:GerMN domain-containing protein [Lachnospiraceae bacterium]
MKKSIYPLLLLLFVVFLTGCSVQEEEESLYHHYYLDMDETRLQEETYTPEADVTNVDEMVAEFVDGLHSSPETSTNVNLLPESVNVNTYALDGTMLTLDLGGAYLDMPKAREVLVRAGIVRSLVQIDGVDYVTIKTDGNDLTDSQGNVIGMMSMDSFVENSGKQINSYQNTTIDLYFTNETGDRLISESRKLYYSSNVPLERVVVEQLIKGPRADDSYATLPPDMQILGVSMTEGVCYVNLDKAFADHALNIQEEIPIYSIVNSIIDDCNVKEVQIAIEGETNLIFRESMKLDTFYQKNVELIQEES